MRVPLKALEAVEPARRDEPLVTQPYRLFFPLGVLLGWLGVGQWLLFSLQLGGSYRVAFHAMVQVQGFIGAFVAGFLFTFIPRRTMGRAPAAWQLWLCAACPVGLTVFAWLERWALAQSCWLVELLVLAQFVVSRARANRNPRPTPPTLVWIPLALAMGILGSVVAALPTLHAIGKSLVLEGVVTSLVMGIGAMLVPVITRAEAPPQQQGALGPRWPQAVLAVAFVASFFSEGRPAYGIRLAVALTVLVATARLWKPPTGPGVNRWLVWLAAWCLPLGYGLLTVDPSLRVAGLHVIFLGAFGLLALCVGHHVVAAHGGRPELLGARTGPMLWVGLSMATALGARLAMSFDPARYLGWMTVAAVAFIAAGAAWLLASAPLLRGSPGR
ncbi:MAG: NnrS family protein [Archangiaceae bacterium]|nr:NnrS family protein [Archangiaceae bacterium]